MIEPGQGSKDGTAAGGDHDEAFRFGRNPNVRWPFPFTERQYARLLIVRGRVRARLDPIDFQPED